MGTIKFRMAVYTGAAGKYDATAPLKGNEDNFYVDDNLSDDSVNHYETDAVVELSECGMIMAVADGMGGMSAGEVASAMAVSTVQDFFAPGNVTPDMAASADKRRAYLEELVVEADRRIKEAGRDNPEQRDMGSTIILAWVVGTELTVTWLGDSRAYRYNPQRGLELLSEDHSFVQELVQKKLLSYEDTFDHPQGNIVTRSLGDRSTKAQPETRQYSLYQSDILLLCSDGLSGVLRDRKTLDHEGNYYPGENIEDIIRDNATSMEACRDALYNAAERADWYDNVTILLCEMCEGLPPCPLPDEEDDTMHDSEQPGNKHGFWNRSISHVRITPKGLVWMLVLVGVGLAAFLGVMAMKQCQGKGAEEDLAEEQTMETRDTTRKDTISDKDYISLGGGSKKDSSKDVEEDTPEATVDSVAQGGGLTPINSDTEQKEEVVSQPPIDTMKSTVTTIS